jgi:hypothetical protein
MINIFWVPPTLAEEDHFTASLHFLIDNAPEVGQALIDHIAEAAAIASTRFLSAVDHPYYATGQKPDFRLEGEDFDILCEHKVTSRLRVGQLENYLGIRRKKRTYVALIARDRCTVPALVLRHARYLRPRSMPAHHFCWSAFHPIIARRSDRLARDFTDFMQLLGMAPVPAAPREAGTGRAMLTVDDICVLADEAGLGRPFRTLRSAAERNGLYARPYKGCVMYTAPQNRSRLLFTVWATSTTDNHIGIYVSPSTFAEFYPAISRRKAKRVLGDEGWHEMDRAAIGTFIEGLDQLLAEYRGSVSR